MTDNKLKTVSIVFGAIFLLYTPVMANDEDDQPALTDISMDQARDAVEDAGYTRISSVEFDDGQWEIDAKDDQGRDVDVTVDASTGKVIKVDR